MCVDVQPRANKFHGVIGASGVKKSCIYVAFIHIKARQNMGGLLGIAGD